VRRGGMGMRVVTVNDVLDGHVALDLECLDRIYLNAYVPTLQTSAQVAAFLTRHLGFPLPSPASFKQLGDRSADPCARSPTPATSPGWPSISTTTSWRSCVGIWPARRPRAARGGGGWGGTGVPAGVDGLRAPDADRGSPMLLHQGRPARHLLLLLPLGHRLRPGTACPNWTAPAIAATGASSCAPSMP
jgi:hypothetical protein